MEYKTLKCKIKDRVYNFEVEPGYLKIVIDDKGLAFIWIRETQFKNIIWMRIANFTWKWPFIHHVATFTDRS